MAATPLCILLTLLAADPTGHAAAHSPQAKSAPAAKKATGNKAIPNNAASSKASSRKATTRKAATTAPARNATAKAKVGARAKVGATAKVGAGASTSKDRKAAKSDRKSTARTSSDSARRGKDARAHATTRTTVASRAGKTELSRARELLLSVKQDPVRRRYKHEWEKAIRALEHAAKGRDRAPALLEAARARYALYRFSSDEADRDRALSLARKARGAGARDADTFIAAVRREAGDDEPARATASHRAAPKPKSGAAKPAQRPSKAGSTPAREEPPSSPAADESDVADELETADEPPDTDPVLDRILAQLAEDPDSALDSMFPTRAAGEIATASPDAEGSSAANGQDSEDNVDGAALALAENGRSQKPPSEQATPPNQALQSEYVPPSDQATPAPSSPGRAGPTKKDALASIIADLPIVDLPAAEDAPSGPIRKIVIDPGHGGHDSGAVGPTRLREKDVVLSIARRVARKLRAEGYEVVLTREDDRYLALAERTALANAHEGDLFVSIHANAHPRRDRQGVETWVLDVNSDRYSRRLAARENGIVDDADSPLDVRRILADLDAKVSAQASRRLARVVQQEMTAGIRKEFGPVRDLGVKSALFYVLLGARMPAVLVETSFISNRAEEKRLASGKFQDEVASALVRAIGTFSAQQSRIAAR